MLFKPPINLLFIGLALFSCRLFGQSPTGDTVKLTVKQTEDLFLKTTFN